MNICSPDRCKTAPPNVFRKSPGMCANWQSGSDPLIVRHNVVIQIYAKKASQHQTPNVNRANIAPTGHIC